MIVVEDRVKLGFVPGTHLPEIQSAIAKQLGNEKLYASSGFKRVDSDKDLLNIFHKHWISAPKYSLVIWRSGLVHYEATAREKISIYGLHHFESLKNTPNQLRIRYVVGVHRAPSTTSQESLRKMAILASRGLSHAPYSAHNKKLEYYGKNIVNSKNTLYRKPRNLSNGELEYMRNCLNFETKDIDKISKFKQFLMGCRGDFSLEDIFTDSKCLNLIN